MSTKGSSTFVINPDIPEATRLKSWYLKNLKMLRIYLKKKKGFYILICNTFVFYRCANNKTQLEQLTLKKSYVGSSSAALKAPASHEIIEVKDIQFLEEKV